MTSPLEPNATHPDTWTMMQLANWYIARAEGLQRMIKALLLNGHHLGVEALMQETQVYLRTALLLQGAERIRLNAEIAKRERKP